MVVVELVVDLMFQRLFDGERWWCELFETGEGGGGRRITLFSLFRILSILTSALASQLGYGFKFLAKKSL